jgi:pectin methylesterase-like acyl-CoA thioesterase
MMNFHRMTVRSVFYAVAVALFLGTATDVASRKASLATLGLLFPLDSLTNAQAKEAKTEPLLVAADGSEQYRSVQQAIDALPPEGGTVHILPGTYREVVTISKAHVRLLGSSDPSRVTVVFNKSHSTAGGTLKSASVTVTGDDFFAEGITFANDFSLGKPLAPEGSQAVALAVKGDRAVFRNIRLLGAQDTLYVGSKSCASEQGPCVPARQYFSDCYIGGNVDFIFGDAKAFFHRCHIHALSHEVAFLTAQSKHYPAEESGFVFESCRVTADPTARHVFLGRPWRPYSTVIFLNTHLPANIEPAGWREWHPGETHSLETAFYAEFKSKGPGANGKLRDPHAKQLSVKEAQSYSLREFLSGQDHWNPVMVQ